MSRDQLQQIGAVLASHVDMVKGFMGAQFSVSIICRHHSGPFHLLLGDDGELALIQTLSELQRIGKHLVRVGEDGSVVPVQSGDPDELTEWDHMVNLLQEADEFLCKTSADASSPNFGQLAEDCAELARRIEQVLDMVVPQRRATPQPEDGQLTEVRPVPFPPSA